MTELIIKHGFVIDPTQNLDGDVTDVAIKDGKIVDKVSSSAKIIDAKGKIVMAGGVDVHAHVAGAARGQAVQEPDGSEGIPDGIRVLYPQHVQDRVRLRPYGICIRNGGSNAPDPLAPRA
jgi:predicted amidohydrolase